MSERWIPQEVILFLDITLIILLAIWSYQMVGYRQTLTEINTEKIEDCFYIDCESDFFGNLFCKELPMGGGVDNWRKTINTSENHIPIIER